MSLSTFFQGFTPRPGFWDPFKGPWGPPGDYIGEETFSGKISGVHPGTHSCNDVSYRQYFPQN